MIPVNYRPVLIEGRLEASYPSSTTLLVVSVMPTLMFQAYRRVGLVCDVDEFDKEFPPKEKPKLPGQIFG